MTNPVLVKVTRGNVTESNHRGAVAVVDADGHVMTAIGDIERPVYPRSAVKAIQALPLVESGAADTFGFGDREIALACASHSGEPKHTAIVRSMLASAGLDEASLECGTHWPTRREAAFALARTGASAGALHNNCSGKHSGFICACGHLRIDHRGYSNVGHPVQEMAREALAAVTGVAHETDACGTDGCSIPTYAVPLTALAHGFARMATGVGLGPVRAAASRRIMEACMAEPFLVAGTGRFDTGLMAASSRRVFVKTGAEGVYCGAVPELGIGIAVKCDDGAARASETIIAAVLARLLAADEALCSVLGEMARPVLKNWNGIAVGDVSPTDEIA